MHLSDLVGTVQVSEAVQPVKVGLDLQMDLQNGLTFFTKWTYKTLFWPPSKIEETARNFKLNPENR